MTPHQKVVTVVGGTGFLGAYVVRELTKLGYTVRVISRDPERALHLKTAGHIGQVVLQKGDITRPETLEGKLEGSYAVINLVGIMLERGHNSFSAVHAQGAEKLAKCAQKCGAARFIHISAVGVNKSQNSKYARSKATGEKAVKAAFERASILRPSVMFGPNDVFYHRFAAMASLSPAIPLIGGGKTRFQPVYVGDVARAIVHVLENDATAGQTYELGGPRVYTLREVVEYTLMQISKKRWLMSVPFSLASLCALPAKLLPHPPITGDQVQLLKYDNVVDREAKTLADLEISATPVEMIMPKYLQRYRKNLLHGGKTAQAH